MTAVIPVNRHVMTHVDAEAIAKAAWGPKAFATELRQYLGTEVPGEDGFRIPAGPVFSYQLGVSRQGKTGRNLSTLKGSATDGFDGAVQDALLRCRSGTDYKRRLVKAIAEYQRRIGVQK